MHAQRQICVDDLNGVAPGCWRPPCQTGVEQIERAALHYEKPRSPALSHILAKEHPVPFVLENSCTVGFYSHPFEHRPFMTIAPSTAPQI